MEKRSSRKALILFLSIVLVQIFFLCLTFGLFKEGYHSDELWNYGIANSFDSNELLITKSGESLSNQWLDSERFNDFLTVRPDQKFAYDRVYYNASRSLNPPFQQFLLHTICSFFPGVFSPWFCFFINIISFFGIQVYLFLLTFKISKNKILAFAAVILFGFGIGAFDIVLFLRMYALGIFFAMMFAYYSHVIYENRKAKIKPINYILLFISCFLGAFTLHEFLVFAFAITFCYTLYYLLSKNFKVFLLHGFICAIAVALSFFAFPTTISNTTGNTNSLSYARASYPFGMQYKLYWYYLTKDLFGVHTDPLPNPYFEIFLGCLVFVVILLIPLIILIRKEKWFNNLLDFIKKDTKNTVTKIKNLQFSLVPLIISVFFIIIIASLRTSIYSMGLYSNRYVFLVYPVMVISFLVVLYYLISFVIRNKKTVVLLIVLFISVFLSILSHVFSDDIYYFEFPEEGFVLSEFEEDANCIIIVSADWAALLFSPYLRNTTSFYVSTYKKYEDNKILDNVDLNSPVYLILEQSLLINDEETKELYYSDEGEELRKYYYDGDVILDFYKSLNEIEDVEYVGHQVLFQRDFYIYRLISLSQSVQ